MVYYTVILQHIILYIQCYLYTTSPLLILWDAQQELTCRQTANLQTANLQTGNLQTGNLQTVNLQADR